MQGLRVILALLLSKSPLGCQHLQLGEGFEISQKLNNKSGIFLGPSLEIEGNFSQPKSHSSYLHGNRLWFQSVFNKLLFLLELIKENQESFSMYGIPSCVLYQFESHFKDVHFHFIADTKGREFWVKTKIV